MSFKDQLRRHGSPNRPTLVEVEKKPLRAPRQKELIFVAIPAVEDKIHAAISVFLSILDRASMHPDCPYAFSHEIFPGLRNVDYARNRIVGRFLRSTASRLWMIDDDMMPSSEMIDLLAVDADIVVPRMFAFKRANAEPQLQCCAFKHNLNGDGKFNAIVPTRPIPIEVDSAGTGAILIKRRVLEDRRVWYPCEYEWNGVMCNLDDERLSENWAPPIFRFHYKPNGEMLRGEDLDFCLRAREAGYKIMGHMGVACGHAKLVNLDDVALIANNAIAIALGHKDPGLIERKASGA